MQIQKSKLSQIADQISKQLSTLTKISKSKQTLSQKINHQISALFNLISPYPTISSRELTNIFQPLHIKLLLQNKKYLTVQDLCAYLGVSQKNAVRGDTGGGAAGKSKFGEKDKEVSIDVRYQLEDIMDKEVEAMEKIKEALRMASIDAVFGEIDFFNNGYVDATSLAEFVKHYCEKGKDGQSENDKNQGKNSNDCELRCMEVIRYLKGSATAQKIFYNDFITLFQDSDPNQNPEQTFHIPNFANHSLSLSRSIGHIARVSDLQLLHSRNKKPKQATDPTLLIEQSNLHNFTISNANNSVQKIESDQRYQYQYQSPYEDISTIKGKLTQEDVDRINRTVVLGDDLGLGYEERICGNHWRNFKYLERLKMESTITNFKPNKMNSHSSSQQNTITQKPQSQSSQALLTIPTRSAHQKYKNSFPPIKPQVPAINCPQILYQLKYLGQLYDKHKKQLQNFLTQNQHFTIINGFNVIDVADRGWVCFKDFREFLVEAEVVVGDVKVKGFFQGLAQSRVQGDMEEEMEDSQEDKVIYYAKFAMRVFHLKTIQNLYRSCRKRRALISQEWPEEQKKNYCRFIRSIISIFYQISTAKQSLRKMLQLPEQQSQESNPNLSQLKDKMQQIFCQSDIHHQKLKQMLGKNSETMVAQMYGEQTILQPNKFYDFLYNIV